MRRAIFLLLFGIFMNTVDKVGRGEIQNPLLLITKALFSEPNHHRHFFLDKQCNPVSEWTNCGNLSKFASLHFPFGTRDILEMLNIE